VAAAGVPARPVAVPMTGPQARAAESPKAAFQRRALALAAAVGIAWVVILLVLDRLIF
jgi:hypothetical protein